MSCAVGIYAIENTVTGECYVGQSTDIAHRWCTHLRELNRGDYKVAAGRLQASWDTGVPHRFMVLEWCPREHLEDREDWWIEVAGDFNGRIRGSFTYRHPDQVAPPSGAPRGAPFGALAL